MHKVFIGEQFDNLRLLQFAKSSYHQNVKPASLSLPEKNSIIFFKKRKEKGKLQHIFFL